MEMQRRADVTWSGPLATGSGRINEVTSGAFGGLPVSWPARTEEANGLTSPEELIAAAHSACFSMALSAALGKAGTPPQRLETHAEVDFQPGTGITQIRLSVRGTVDGVDADGFRDAAEGAKTNCPVSKALTGVEITLDASLT